MKPARLLILGGTGEAIDLASACGTELPNLQVITSLAGRTQSPRLPVGDVRVGGFGGVQGLAHFLEEASIDLLVDATHPFAQQITWQASAACRLTKVPRLRLCRPPWRRQPGDRWIEVESTTEAAENLPEEAKRIFLSIGRQELSAFDRLDDRWFLVRTVEMPEAALPLSCYELLLGRGPFTRESEEKLLIDHAIDLLVSKNSGGDATYGKIAAARALGLPVLMLRSPPEPAGTRAKDTESALSWLKSQLSL